ncbi:uncharacterized protein LOC115621356 [Scaptodrosophila lebanonensis]|uniref:Uncharacterized protein LOC115621356 n=1 Tax=Drosophila lebanonensis TaxID=7225 RepID=A0A6J2T6U6_DROLE|nr:uncharacterized protein LOC115621356 [Scaptodrosophila lebanonensis]
MMLTVCRLCLADDANFAIFTSTIPLRIITCAALEVQPDDGLPQAICATCRVRLEECYYFRKRCHAVDRRLRRIKRLGKSGLLEGTADEDDAVLELDAVPCTPTACTESAANWRTEAAQLIRSEIEAYKKELLVICKQKVREEIEQEVRNEVEEFVMAEASRQCRLNVLDDLSYELERFLSRKRNEVFQNGGQQYSEGFISDSETHELESTSTMVGDCYVGNDEADQDSSVELLDDGLDPKVKSQENVVGDTPHSKDSTSTQPNAGTSQVVPMVVINMEDNQMRYLREDFSSATFLTSKSSPKSPLKNKDRKKRGKFKSPIRRPTHQKIRERVCRKHSCAWNSYKTTQRHTSLGEEPWKNCIRCRLRGSNPQADPVPE